jgi:hypothetical protein
MDMADRRTSTGGTRQKKAGTGGRRRVEKSDGKNFTALVKEKSSSSLVLPAIKEILLAEHQRNSERSARRSNSIFPSEMARSEWCPRATYYRMSGLPEQSPSSFSFGLDNVFSEGNRIHSKWQGWMAKTGDLWGDWYCNKCDTRINNTLIPDSSSSIEMNIFETIRCYHEWEYKEVTLKSVTHRISGHADGALLSKNCLIEIKSMGIGTFRFEAPNLLKEHTYEISGKKIVDIEGMWKSLHRPLISHVKQGNIYLHMAEEMGMPFDEIVFIYEFKANQQIKEFRIKKSDDILRPLLDICSAIEYALETGVPVPCPFGGCGACRTYEGG